MKKKSILDKIKELEYFYLPKLGGRAVYNESPVFYLGAEKAGDGRFHPVIGFMDVDYGWEIDKINTPAILKRAKDLGVKSAYYALTDFTMSTGQVISDVLECAHGA